MAIMYALISVPLTTPSIQGNPPPHTHTHTHAHTHEYRSYQLYTDSLVHDEAALKYLVGTVGVDNVVLGSDYPFPLGEHHPGKLIESVQDWDQETKVITLSTCVSL